MPLTLTLCSKGRTALHGASHNGLMSVVSEILAVDGGRESIRKRDGQGRTPLFLACANGHTGVLARLIGASSGEDLTAPGKRRG